MLFRHQEKKEINFYIRCLEIKKELVSKGGSKAMYELLRSRTISVCSRNGRYSVEVQVQSLFQDQTVSWI